MAALDRSHIHDINFATPQIHQDYFNSDIDPEDEGKLVDTSYLLLDLPTELLEQVTNCLKSPDRHNLQMEFRGRSHDEVVLTLPDKTYQLRTVQNSNSVMICGTSSSEEEDTRLRLSVLKVVHETIELIDITKFPGTRLDRVKQLLQHHLYTGETDEIQRQQDLNSHLSSPPVTLSSLSEEVRASDAEIRNYMEELYVVELNGVLRMISLGYLSSILSGLLKALDDLQVGPHEEFAIEPVADIVTSRLDINQVVFLQILSKFSSKSLEPNHRGQTTNLNIEKIVNLIGLSQLLSVKPIKVEPSSNPKDHRYIQKVAIDNFLSVWRSKLMEPYRDYCSIKALESHSILSNDQQSLIVVPINKLSLEPKIRMSQLFEIQPKWRLDQIEKFLFPITGGGIQKKIDELVLKFCRKIKDVPQSSTSTSKKDAKVSETVWLTARNKW